MAITKHKHSRPVVVVDMDGIVADFIFSMTQIMKQLFGVPEYPVGTFQAGAWGVEWLGLTPEHEEKFWEYVRNESDSFWVNEREIIPGIVAKFDKVATSRIYDDYGKVKNQFSWYWCTTRDDCHDGTAQAQSRLFLENNGFYNPSVVVSDKKGDFCYSVNATYFLDDKFDNCRQVREKSPDTKVFFLMLDSGKRYKEAAELAGMEIITSADQFIQFLKNVQAN